MSHKSIEQTEKPKVCIKPATKKKDLQIIEALAHEIWHEHYRQIISEAQIEYMLEKGYSLEVMQSEIASGVSYDGLFINDSMIGYCSYGRDADKTLKLHKLYLKPSYHGKGYGRLLLEHIYNYAKNNSYDKITLQVNKQNQIAIRAYKKFGFIIAHALVLDIGGGFVMDDYRLEITVR